MTIPASDGQATTQSLSLREWRSAVTRSDLPNGAKLTLLEHSNRGFGRFHSSGSNQHGVTVERLMEARGISRRSVQYHLRMGREAGFLMLAEGGWRGHQQVFNYTVPGALKGATHYTLSEDANCTPKNRNAAQGAAGNSDEEAVVVPLRAETERLDEAQSDRERITTASPRLGTEPPVADQYAGLPIVMYVLSRLTRIQKERTMASEAFHDDQPLDLGLTELSWPPEATVAGCCQAWHKGWASTHEGDPDPTWVKRAMAKIKHAARDRTDLDTWRNLWVAARDSGAAGVWNVDSYLGAPPRPRGTMRGNRYTDLMASDHARTLAILDGEQHKGIAG